MRHLGYGPFLALAALFLSPLLASAAEYLVFIGTYTENTASKGIYAYRFDSATGQLTDARLAAATTNPSFLAVDPKATHMYAVNEVGNFEGKNAGSVTAFALDRASGRLTQLNQSSSLGAGPCHLAVDHTGKHLFVANYSGGSVAAIPINSDGRLGDSAVLDQHSGRGSNAERQEGPHAHCTNLAPDNRFVFVADLGLDKVFSYRVRAGLRKLQPGDPAFASTQPGAGPRHMAFSPNRPFVYVICELNSTIAAYHYDAKRGALHELQTISTLPPDFRGENTTAEIFVHPNGRFLYGSNRGHDSIALFAIDPATGKLTPVAHTPTEGQGPRSFAIDPSGNFLIAANQKTDNAVVFRIDSATGKLTPTGQKISVAAPVCVLFVPVK